MNENHIDGRWRWGHWKEWRNIRNRWNQIRKTRQEPNQQSERVRGAAFERRAQLRPSRALLRKSAAEHIISSSSGAGADLEGT